MSESKPLQMPTAEIAEQNVLSWLCEKPEYFFPRLRAAGVVPDSFHIHKRVFAEVCRFIEINGNFDLPAFAQDMTTQGKIEGLGGMSRMVELTTPTHPAKGWPKWIEQLQEAYGLRLAILAGRKVETAENADEAIAELEDTLEAIRRATKGQGASKSAKTAARAFVDKFQADHAAGDLPGIATGIQRIDDASGGLRAGELWVVGGGTSRGKSVLMYQVACEVLATGGKVAIFSMELGAAEIVGRLTSCHGRIPYGDITKPRGLTQGALRQITAAVTALAEWKFWVDDTPCQTIDHIVTEAQAVRDTAAGLDLVVVDYLQMIEDDRNRKGESREQQVARASRGLKQLAKMLECPVFTASQLNDEGKVRESRAISHDADALLLITDDGIKTAKMRNGMRNEVIPVFLDGNIQRFREDKPL